MLKVDKLDVYYGRIQALRGVSVDVNEGELVTLIGGNGGGKTTFLMTLCGIVKATSGTVQFWGTRIDKLPSHSIFNLGIAQVPQGRELFSNMTVLENLELGAYQCKAREGIKDRLEKIFGHFDVLYKRKNQKAGTLSGGEQQMLTIGRALMSEPKLLLLDEPASGLSPLLVNNLTQIIKSLHKEGLTILLVEQNVPLALELADRGYLLESGSVVAMGTKSELTQNELVRKAYMGM